MEFFPYNALIDELKVIGLIAEESGDHVRFSLEATTAGAKPRAIVFGAGDDADPDAARTIEKKPDELPNLLDTIIHKEHLNQIALIPIAQWSKIVDLVAFDLATDEHWNEIDAEASLHHQTRNPLLLDSPYLRLAQRIASVVIENGDSSDEDFAILAIGTPLVMTLEQRGRLIVWCGNEAMADVIASIG